MKKILIFFLIVVLSACSSGGGGSKNVSTDNVTDNNTGNGIDNSTDNNTGTIKYNVKFDAAGGFFSGGRTSYVITITILNNKIVNIDTIEIPYRTGYNFNGWNNGVASISGEQTIEKDTTFYASWQEIPEQKFKVILNANGGKINTDDNQSLLIVKNSMFDPDDYTDNLTAPFGFKFRGWFKDAMCTINVDGVNKIVADTVYYACWQHEKVSINFNANGGKINTSSTLSVEHQKGLLFDVSSYIAFSDDGWIFEGWYDAVSGGNKVTGSITVSSDIVLYAQWTKSWVKAFNTGMMPMPVKINDFKVVDNKMISVGEYTEKTKSGKNIYGIVVKYDQSGNIIWQKQVYGGHSSFSAVDVAADGSIYAVGFISGDINFDFGNNVVSTGLKSLKKSVIVKYSATGETEWVYCGNANSWLTAVVTGSDGIYAVGSETDAAIIHRYSNSGDLVWSSTASGGTSIFSDVAVSSDGVYAVGYQEGDETFEYDNNSCAGDSLDSNGVMVKYSFMGSVTWIELIKGDSSSSFNSISITEDAVYVAGAVFGDGIFNFGTVPFSEGDEPFDTHGVLAKYTKTGTALWVVSGSGDEMTEFTSVSAYGDNVTVAGYQSGNLPYTYGSINLVAGGDRINSVIIRYNSSGVALWGSVATVGTGASRFDTVNITDDGIVYAVGFQGGRELYTYNGISYKSETVFPNILIKYNNIGNCISIFETFISAKGNYALHNHALDNDGNIYVVGQFLSTGTYTLDNKIINSNDKNAFIFKTDTLGNIIWIRVVENSNSESYFSAVSVGSDGIYAVGFQEGTGSYDYGGVLLSGSADKNAVIVKYSTDGVVMWGKIADSLNDSVFNSIAVDENSVYATGFQCGEGEYGGISTNTTNFGENAVLVKYDSTGNVNWVRSAVGSESSEFTSVAVEGGNTYVVGYQTGTGNFTYGTGIIVNGKNNSSHAVLVKYNSDGIAQWVKTAYGKGSKFSSVAIDGMHIYVAGYQNGNDNFEYGNGVNITVAKSGNHAILAKYLHDNTTIWVNGIDSDNSMYDNVVFDDEGAVYVTGKINGDSFHKLSNSLSLSADYAAGDNSIVAKYSDNGTALWGKAVSGGGNYSFITSISFFNNNVYLLGVQNGSGLFDYDNGVTFSGDHTENQILMMF